MSTTDDLTTIRVLAATLDDLERQRIQTVNRIGAAERALGDALPHLHVVSDSLERIEHQTKLLLNRAWRRHYLAPWAAEQKGVGPQVARLIALTGAPSLRGVGHWEGEGPERRWIVDSYEPRTVSQLWAYCGHGDPSRRKAAGMSQAELFALGNPDAKMRVHLIAATCMRAKGTNGTTRSRYRDVYDARRELTAGRLHATECKRCGPSGHPAKEGSPWSDAHALADALRIVGKEFLKDLWIEDSRLHAQRETQRDAEAA